MTDVRKSEILHIWHVCDVENVAIYAKFATIYALSRGEKMSPKVHLWRKNDKYEVWTTAKKIPKMILKEMTCMLFFNPIS